MKKKNTKDITAREWIKTPEGQRKMAELNRPIEEAMQTLTDSLKSLDRDRTMTVSLPVSRPVHLDEASLRAIRAGTGKTIKAKDTLLEYRDDGNFYTRGKLIDFPDPKADYVLVIKALLQESDAGGFLSYNDLYKYLERHGRRRFAEDEKVQRHRIANALTTLKHKRKRQKVQFPFYRPDGSHLIRAVPAGGLVIEI